MTNAQRDDNLWIGREQIVAFGRVIRVGMFLRSGYQDRRLVSLDMLDNEIIEGKAAWQTALFGVTIPHELGLVLAYNSFSGCDRICPICRILYTDQDGFRYNPSTKFWGKLSNVAPGVLEERRRSGICSEACLGNRTYGGMENNSGDGAET